MAYVEVDRWEGSAAQAEAAPPSPWEPLGDLVALAMLVAIARLVPRIASQLGGR